MKKLSCLLAIIISISSHASTFEHCEFVLVIKEVHSKREFTVEANSYKILNSSGGDSSCKKLLSKSLRITLNEDASFVIGHEATVRYQYNEAMSINGPISAVEWSVVK